MNATRLWNANVSGADECYARVVYLINTSVFKVIELILYPYPLLNLFIHQRLHMPQTKAHLDVLADALLRWARGR